MEAFLLTTWQQKPRFMWIGWILNAVSVLTLIISLGADSLTAVTFKIKETATFSGLERSGYCGWQSFTVDASGFQDTEYSSAICSGTAECALTKQGGAVWLTFAIFAFLFNAVFFYGVFLDYYSGQWGTRLFQNIGLGGTNIGLGGIILCEIIMCIAWSAAEQCSSLTLWKLLFAENVTDLSSVGGASLGFVSLSIIFNGFIVIMLLYIYYTKGELPKGEKRDIPFKFELGINLNNSPPKPNNSQPVKPAVIGGQAPKVIVPSSSPSPSPKISDNNNNKIIINDNTNNNITKPNGPPPPPVQATTNNNNNNNSNNSNNKPPPVLPGNKPNKPVPLPGKKPTGPPPVPVPK